MVPIIWIPIIIAAAVAAGTGGTIAVVSTINNSENAGSGIEIESNSPNEASAYTVPGIVYEVPNNEKYYYWESYSDADAVFGENALISISIDGNLSELGQENGISKYAVRNGNVGISFVISDNVVNGVKSQWWPSSDGAKSICNIELDGSIQRGALVIQSSLDGKNWIDEGKYTNIFTDEAVKEGCLYTTKDIQLQNGCFYRIIVAYELCHRLEDSKIIGVINQENYDYKNFVEYYEFYIENSDKSLYGSSQDTPRKKLGSKVKTGLNNGYLGDEGISKDDPHYGWDLGEFFVNGYTRETKDSNGQPVFLKNLGDRVTLWFTLKQDINCLNGNDYISISWDNDGYDERFEIPQTDFRRGTLIISYTDYQGVVHDPIIYTDFIAADTIAGADTRVQLFEEGDYVVALDYEIAKNNGSTVFGPRIEYYNYQILFSFSIRNGNCMVYPRDVATGSELADGTLTENGFMLDMARSRYLTIDDA